MDIKALGDQVIAAVKSYVAKATEAIEGRIAGLDDKIKQIPAGASGKDGAPGKDGEKGADGIDGKDGAPGKDGERGADGIDGKDGAPGKDGEKGADGIDGKDGAPGDRGEKGDPGDNGKDGAPGDRGEKGDPGDNGKDGAPGDRGEKGDRGDNGKDGMQGAQGEKGDAGADGKSITLEDINPLIETAIARSALEFERRATDVLQRAIDNMPEPKAGKDGFSAEDLKLEALDGGRTIRVKLMNGDREIVRELQLAIPLDRGVYKFGMEAKAGDCVTYGGSLWIAQRDTNVTPGKSDDWRLAVKRGQDGKDSK